MFGVQQTQQLTGGQGGGMTSTVASNDKFTEFVKQVSGEMSSWESAGLWQLSALCPMKEFPLIPGFEDTSYEELRVAAYTAKSNPTAMQEYQNMLSEKMMRHKQLRDALRSATPEAVQILREVFNKAHKLNSAAGTSNSSSTSNLFGKPQISPFSQNSGAFGTSTGTSNSNSLFGSNPATSNNLGMSLFGKPQSSVTFGASSAFGSLGSSSNNSSSLFGSPQQAKPMFGAAGGSAFGSLTADANNTSVFGAPSGTSLFGSTVPQSSGSGGSLFGGGTTSTNSLFGNATISTPSIFGGGTTTASVFGNQPSSTSGGSAFGNVSIQPSVFGTANPSSDKVFGGSSSMNNSSGNEAFGSSSGVNKNLFPGTSGSTTSVFGQTTSTGPSNAFGSGSSVFNAGNSAFSSVTNSTVQNQPSLFGSVSSGSSLFGGSAFSSVTTNSSQPQQPVFGGTSLTSSSSVFGNTIPDATTHVSAFGSAVTPVSTSSIFTVNTGNSSSSIFANPSPLQSSASTSVPSETSTVLAAFANPNDERYSQMNQLQDMDREQFLSDQFMYVPSIPPPRELCF
ncbi:Nucleoporin FG repeat [Trinorchestia longiramus]|nr:Nucleoporin FG repeat [Trinorchestia longiramus]